MSDTFNRQGEPISLEIWSALIRDWDYQTVKRTEAKGLRISTIWLGINHNWSGNGKPLIFETMVFKLDDKGEMQEDIFCDRYETLTDAKKAHDRIVDEIMNETFKGYENE